MRLRLRSPRRNRRGITTAEEAASTQGSGGRERGGEAQSSATAVVSDSAITGADECETTRQQRIARENISSDLVGGTKT